jgi:hypothetical protein
MSDSPWQPGFTVRSQVARREQTRRATAMWDRWRPGEHGRLQPAEAPWLCVTAFRRLCSEQRVGRGMSRRLGMNVLRVSSLRCDEAHMVQRVVSVGCLGHAARGLNRNQARRVRRTILKHTG